jgi:hypothetical protein
VICGSSVDYLINDVAAEKIVTNGLATALLIFW